MTTVTKYFTKGGAEKRVNGEALVVGFASAVLYCVISFARHYSYQSGIDLAIFGQSVKAYSLVQPPFVSLKSQAPFNILGDHFSPIIAVIAPLYRVFPHIEVLLVVQAVLFGWAVYLLGRRVRRHASRRSVVLAMVCVASCWGILAAVRFDFHEIAFTVPFVVLAVEAAEAKAWVRMGVWCALLMLTKEDSTFLIGGIALMLLTRRQVRPALITGGASVVAFVVLVEVVIPFFSFYHRYTYFAVTPTTYAGLCANVWQTLHQPLAWIMLALVIITLGPGARSPIALVIVPTLLSRLVSDNSAYWSLQHHYQTTILVVCCMAAIDGWLKVLPSQRCTSMPRRVCIAHAVLLTVVSVGFLQAVGGLSTVLRGSDDPARAHDFAVVVSQVPANITIIADTYALSHLVDRDTVYLANESWTDSTGQKLAADWVLFDESSTAEGNRWTPG